MTAVGFESTNSQPFSKTVSERFSCSVIIYLHGVWTVCFYHVTYCVKSVGIRSFSGLHFSAFGLNTEILNYSVDLPILSKSVKMQTRKTPNVNTFYAVTYVYWVNFQSVIVWTSRNSLHGTREIFETHSTIYIHLNWSND